MWLRFGRSVESHWRMSIELLLSFGGQEYFYDMRPWERERGVAMVIQNQLRLPPLILNWQFFNVPKTGKGSCVCNFANMIKHGKRREEFCKPFLESIFDLSGIEMW